MKVYKKYDFIHNSYKTYEKHYINDLINRDSKT